MCYTASWRGGAKQSKKRAFPEAAFPGNSPAFVKEKYVLQPLVSCSADKSQGGFRLKCVGSTLVRQIPCFIQKLVHITLPQKDLQHSEL